MGAICVKENNVNAKHSHLFCILGKPSRKTQQQRGQGFFIYFWLLGLQSVRLYVNFKLRLTLHRKKVCSLLVNVLLYTEIVGRTTLSVALVM